MNHCLLESVLKFQLILSSTELNYRKNKQEKNEKFIEIN